jgi:5'-deoxynucleotidase YfbR-like HD superfamily hydrolase
MPTRQRMYSGRHLDLANPSAMDIDIEDIAHGLSRISRWNGQTAGSHPLSVAQHCIMTEVVCRLITPTAPDHWLLAALLHDAASYALGDMIAPLKNVMGVSHQIIEDRVMQAVHIRFGLPPVMPPQMKKFISRADKITTHIEAVQLAGFSNDSAGRVFGPLPLEVQGWHVDPLSAHEARELYLNRFSQLHMATVESAALA